MHTRCSPLLFVHVTSNDEPSRTDGPLCELLRTKVTLKWSSTSSRRSRYLNRPNVRTYALMQTHTRTCALILTHVQTRVLILTHIHTFISIMEKYLVIFQHYAGRFAVLSQLACITHALAYSLSHSLTRPLAREGEG